MFVSNNNIRTSNNSILFRYCDRKYNQSFHTRKGFYFCNQMLIITEIFSIFFSILGS